MLWRKSESEPRVRGIIELGAKVLSIFVPEKTATQEEARSPFGIEDFARTFGSNIVEYARMKEDEEGNKEVTNWVKDGVAGKAINKIAVSEMSGKLVRYHATITHNELASPYAYDSIFIAKGEISSNSNYYALHLIKENEKWLLGPGTNADINTDRSEWLESDRINAVMTMIELFNVADVSQLSNS